MWQNSLKLVLVASLAPSFAPAPRARADDIVKPVTDPKQRSPKEDLRVKLFKDQAGKAACGSVQIDPKGNSGVDTELDGILKLAVEALKKKDDKALQPLFHPRLNVGLAAIQETFAKLDNTYGAPFDISVYRLWALNTVDGSPKGLTCEDDRLLVFPQYGYPLQFGVWLQIMGQRELGRIFLAIVPAEGRWNIGAFHAQQWTHDSKDFATWAEEGVQNDRMGMKEAAYIKFDIASKLLDGGGFIEIAMRDEAIKARDAVMSFATFDKSVRSALKDFDVVQTATLLVVGGSGILVRIRVPGEISVENMQKECARTAETLSRQQWAAYVEGIRCSYLLPTDDPKKDGQMGGLFIHFSDLKKPG